METLKNPFGFVLASILTGYYLSATAAFQLAPVAEAALLLSTPPLFVLALRRVRGDAPTALELFGTGLAVAGIALILGPRLALAKRFGNRRLVGDVLAVRRY
jgi:drug/metabolite transporter (DMT)-like permease